MTKRTKRQSTIYKTCT